MPRQLSCSIQVLRLLLIPYLICGCAEAKSPATSEPASQPAVKASPNPRRANVLAKIARFDKEDQTTSPPADPILFVGSSTIEFWKTSQAFPGLPVVNRGIGGTHISDVLAHYDRLVARYKPKTIVFYSADNDLAAGKPPAQVANDANEFISRVRRDFPIAKIVFIAAKPSIARWKLIDKYRETNRLMRQAVETKPGDVFVDVESQVLGPDGKPRAELFRADGLHFSDKGYQILDDAVRPYLK
jgi:lysophospholipase L1-like esterase